MSKDELFTKKYCEENKVFGLIQKQNWFITGLFTSFFCAILGAFVNESSTLGYIGFGIGALVDFFMRKEYEKELGKFKEGRSRYNAILMDNGQD